MIYEMLSILSKIAFVIIILIIGVIVLGVLAYVLTKMATLGYYKARESLFQDCAQRHLTPNKKE